MCQVRARAIPLLQMPWNLRLGAVYGPDRRPCPLWPLVELFSEDLENKIAGMLAPQPRLPTPQYYLQLKYSPCDHPYPRRSQFLDAVNRFIDNYWDEVKGLSRAVPMVFVDWDEQGSATIDLSRALVETGSDDDSDDEADSDSDDEADSNSEADSDAFFEADTSEEDGDQE